MENYYTRNREAILAKRKQHYIVNKEKIDRANKEYREANPEKFTGYRNKWLSTNPEHIMKRNAYRRAKESGLPFDIEASDIIIPEICPILDIPLFSSVRSSSENSPSLDRIIPEKGYVKGNIHVISSRANRLKNDASLEELQRLVAYLIDLNQSNA